MASPAVTPTTPHRTVWSIAGPAILANSSAPLIGLVDTWAIGHLPGPVHLAAVGLGSVIFNYLLWAFGFLRMGTTGLVAQAHGAGDPRRLNAEVVRSMALALLFGVALLLLQAPVLALSLQAMAPPENVAQITAEYFRIRIWAAPASLLVYAITGVLFGLASTRTILGLQLLLNISNGIFNVTFVIGFDMGVPGVALGTLLAQWITALVSLYVVVKRVGSRPLLDAMRDAQTWLVSRLARIMAINGLIFVRTLFLMTALALIMRVAGTLGATGMAASHVLNQYMLLMSLGLDGFAHAAEALAGRAWGEASRQRFRYWVAVTNRWAIGAALAYALLFALGGNALTALLTDIVPVRATVAELMPFVIALPLVSVWCYQFDGVFIGATAATAMMVTMGIAFAVYLAVLGPMTEHWGLAGLWGAVLVFMAARGLAQAAWYPRLERSIERQAG
ncbi:MAG: MATE family efflux transporter [Xanthomonadales bacterium]|nr:MATE family efflux transporter [Xanthomonadales bacterium]